MTNANEVTNTNSPIGSDHWYNTLLSKVVRIGEFLSEKTPEENTLRHWGEELYHIGHHLLKNNQGVVSPSPVSKDKTDEDFSNDIKSAIRKAINRHLVVHVPTPGDQRDRIDILVDEAANAISLLSEARSCAVSSLTENNTDENISDDIDTIGNCANCGVEFHIHKAVSNGIPESLNQCRLTKEEKSKVAGLSTYGKNWEENFENAMLEKLAAYLGSVEGLPTNVMPIAEKIAKRLEPILPEDWSDLNWIIEGLIEMRLLAVAALASKEQKHRQEMEEFDKWLRENYHLSDGGKWCLYKYRGKRSDESDIEVKTFSELLASFREENKKKG